MQYASNTILFRISFSAAEVKIFAKMHSFPASRILGLQKTKQNVATKINVYNSCGELFSAIHIHIYKLIVHTYNSMYCDLRPEEFKIEQYTGLLLATLPYVKLEFPVLLQCILSIFQASVHQFYANLLVFVNINPFLFINDQFALSILILIKSSKRDSKLQNLYTLALVATEQ